MNKKENSANALPDCVKQLNRIPVTADIRPTLKQDRAEVFAKYDYTAIEKRLRYSLLYLAASETGVDTIFGRVDTDEFERRYVTIPIKMLMGGSKSHNYDDVRESIRSFNNKTVWYHDENGNEFIAFPLIAVFLTQSRGNVVLKIDRDIWNSFVAESSYYTELDLLRAMQMSSPLEMRIYEIASFLKDTEEFSIDFLREIMCMTEKYKTTGEFIRAIERCAKALNQGDISLIIEKIKENNSRRIERLRMTPKVISDEKIREKDIKERLQKFGLRYILTPYDLQCLGKAGFTEQGICANIVTLKIRQQQMRLEKYDPQAFGDSIVKLAEKAKGKDNPQGWMIEVLKARNKVSAGV